MACTAVSTLLPERACIHPHGAFGCRCRGRNRQAPQLPTPSSQGGGLGGDEWAMQFCLWLLNPAVVFRKLSGQQATVPQPMPAFAGASVTGASSAGGAAVPLLSRMSQAGGFLPPGSTQAAAGASATATAATPAGSGGFGAQGAAPPAAADMDAGAGPATGCKCIILTSGTLSPMDSFASELDLRFDIKLEAPHVVDVAKQVRSWHWRHAAGSGCGAGTGWGGCLWHELDGKREAHCSAGSHPHTHSHVQVWAGVVPCGPDGTLLNGTYKNADTLAYQDSLGAAVTAACQVIPDGVLLFLPSYGLMEKLVNRWKVCSVCMCWWVCSCVC